MNGGKRCLLVLENKKYADFDAAKQVFETISSSGYYFDKIIFADYGDEREVIGELSACVADYSELLLLCPKVLEITVKEYLSAKFGAVFGERDTAKVENTDIFIIFSDEDYIEKTKAVADFFGEKYKKFYEKSYLKTVGAPPEKVKQALERAASVSAEVSFNLSEKFGDCEISMLYPKNLPKPTYDKLLRVLLSELNNYVYAMENITLAEQLVKLLKLRKMKICVAESFTGGGVGKRIVEISGASEVFFEGLNTYSNQSKQDRLGVNGQTLRLHGAVSEHTAFEMAEGLLKRGNCGVCISTTGIAGPKSDNTSKPVGLIYIGVGNVDKGIAVYKYNLKGDRERITKTAINLALFLAYKSIK